MATTIAATTAPAHRVIPDIERQAAKADLRKAEIDAPAHDLRPVIGGCILRARQARGWTLDEFCGHLPSPSSGAMRDARQVRRWEDGTERAQFDVIFGCDDDEFLGLVVVQLAARARRVDVQTVITLRRSA